MAGLCPMCVKCVFMCVHMCMNVCAHMSQVKPSAVRTTLEWALKIYNEEATTVNKIVKEHNLNLLAVSNQKQAHGGEVDWETVGKQAWEYVEVADAQETNDAINHYVSRFFRRWGLGRFANRKPGAHLAYHDPAMEDYRNYINAASSSQGVHERLIAYWDQIWCLAFTPESNVMWKKPSRSGEQMPDFNGKSRTKEALRMAILRTLDPEKYQQCVDEKAANGGWMLNYASIDAYSGIAPPAEWRHPRTLTTLTWRDGHLDATFVTIPKGTISATELQELNDELQGTCMILCTDRESHMWDAEMCIKFLYKFLGVCLTVRRKALGLTSSDKAMFICDRAPSHLQQGYFALRQNFADEYNCVIFGSDPHAQIQVPAKIGAVGSPNDAYHQFIHYLRKYREWCLPFQCLQSSA